MTMASQFSRARPAAQHQVADIGGRWRPFGIPAGAHQQEGEQETNANEEKRGFGSRQLAHVTLRYGFA